MIIWICNTVSEICRKKITSGKNQASGTCISHIRSHTELSGKEDTHTATYTHPAYKYTCKRGPCVVLSKRRPLNLETDTTIKDLIRHFVGYKKHTAGYTLSRSHRERPWRQHIFRLSSHVQLVCLTLSKREYQDWRIKNASCSVYPWARSVTSHYFMVMWW